MKNESHPGQRSGPTPDLTSTPTHTDRLQTVARLFVNSYSELLSIASDHEHVTASDGGAIIDGIERKLYQYSGPPTEGDFFAWAESQIIRERNLIAIMRQHEPAVRKGLWRVLAGATDLGYDSPSPSDRYSTEALLTAEVWLWVWEHLDDLLTPGTAKLSTRLNQRAYWVARRWQTEQLRARSKFADLDEADLLPSDFYAEPLERLPTPKSTRSAKPKVVPAKKPVISKVGARHKSVDSWLIGFLCHGPQPANDVKAAGKEAGYGRVQLEGAVQRLGVVVKPSGFGQPWTWEVPTKIAFLKNEKGDSPAPSLAENTTSLALYQ